MTRTTEPRKRRWWWRQSSHLGCVLQGRIYLGWLGHFAAIQAMPNFWVNHSDNPKYSNENTRNAWHDVWTLLEEFFGLTNFFGFSWKALESKMIVLFLIGIPFEQMVMVIQTTYLWGVQDIWLSWNFTHVDHGTKISALSTTRSECQAQKEVVQNCHRCWTCLDPMSKTD